MKFRIYNLKFTIGLLVALFTFYILHFTFYIPEAYAFDVMSTYKVSDTQAASGDILSNISGKGLVRSSDPYDTHTFGVIVDEPLAVFRNLNADSSERPVATQGDVTVNVTDFNGQINPGDYIASSPVLGKGMKATQDGYILGIATSTETVGQTLNFQDKSYKEGQIQATLRIGYNTPAGQPAQSIFASVAASFLKNAQDPSRFAVVMRYIIAGGVAALAFAIGLFAFTRAITKGIEAMGRNPLAKKSIQTSIIIEVILTLIVTFGAIVLAFLILRA